MKDFKHQDRRKCQRIPLEIPLRLSFPDEETQKHLEARSINICMNGLYCSVSRYVPLFDRILITLVAPGQNGSHAHVISQIEGTVVRVEPEQELPKRKEYKIAMYFQALSKQQHSALHQLLESHAAIRSEM